MGIKWTCKGKKFGGCLNNHRPYGASEETTYSYIYSTLEQAKPLCENINLIASSPRPVMKINKKSQSFHKSRQYSRKTSTRSDPDVLENTGFFGSHFSPETCSTSFSRLRPACTWLGCFVHIITSHIKG
jgi:hypothetical protein